MQQLQGRRVAVTARASSAPAAAPSRPLSVRVREASAVDWWPASDAHCRVFNEAPCPNNSRQAAAQAPPADCSQLQELGAWGLWAARRVDTVQALATNEALAARAGWGKTALLLACTPPGHQLSASDPPQAPTECLPTAGPMPPVVVSVATALVAPAARGAVGTSAEEAGIVAVINVDSFGDRVPARALDAQRDGAFGWYRRTGIAYIANLAVLPHARRHGVARQLVQSAEQLAAQWGCRSIGLHCNPKNTAAIQLYRSLGYRTTAFLEEWWMPWLMGRPPDRCAFMIKRLPAASPSHSPQQNQQLQQQQTVESAVPLSKS